MRINLKIETCLAVFLWMTGFSSVHGDGNSPIVGNPIVVPEEIAVDPAVDIQVELPLQLREMLLERTGTKSILSIDGLVLRSIGKFDILAVKAELENWSDIKVGIQEGIMHVDVAFVEDKESGRVKLYAIDFPINNFLNMEKVDSERGFTELKALEKN